MFFTGLNFDQNDLKQNDVTTTASAEVKLCHRGRPQRDPVSSLEKIPFQPKQWNQPQHKKVLFRPSAVFIKQIVGGICAP